MTKKYDTGRIEWNTAYQGSFFWKNGGLSTEKKNYNPRQSDSNYCVKARIEM